MRVRSTRLERLQLAERSRDAPRRPPIRCLSAEIALQAVRAAAPKSSRLSARATLPRSSPILSPQSWVTPSYSTAVKVWHLLRVDIASVSWISTPAQRSWVAKILKISG